MRSSRIKIICRQNSIPTVRAIYNKKKYHKKGGFGTVYFGKIVLPDGTYKKAALKHIPCTSEGDVDSICSEIKYQVQMQKITQLVCNIIGICICFDTETDQHVIIAMELFPCTLKKYIENQPKIAKSLLIIGQLLSSIRSCHINNILHLDLKPSNILITDRFEIRLIDFGLSQSNKAVDLRYRSGTEDFYPPEYYCPNGPIISKAADSWACGMIINQILSNHAGDPTVDLIRKKVTCFLLQSDVITRMSITQAYQTLIDILDINK